MTVTVVGVAKYRRVQNLKTELKRGTEPVSPKCGGSRRSLDLLLRRPWVHAVGVIVLSLSLALNILFPDAGGELFRQAVLRHSQSFASGHAVEVASPNPQVVKTWLTAKLDFVPSVVGSPASGYSLVGGPG